MTDNDPIQRFAAIRVSGADRIAFLQGQLSNDLRQLQPDRPMLAGWSNPQGRLICTLWVVDWQDATWLLLPDELQEAVVKRLRMFVLRADVQIETASWHPEQQLTDAAEGAKSANKIDNKNSLISCFYNDDSYSLQVCNGALLVLYPAADTTTLTDSKLCVQWQRKTIHAGIPIIRRSTSAEFVPQMVNLDLIRGISFTKGCYVGQEIVARTQNLGRIKRRMFAYSAQTLHPVKPGDVVYADDGTAGQIVNCARSAADTVDLLAVIRLDQLAAPLRLRADDHEVLQPLSLPYRVPEVADR
jgi:folate-binding protein YgfZ